MSQLCEPSPEPSSLNSAITNFEKSIPWLNLIVNVHLVLEGFKYNAERCVNYSYQILALRSLSTDFGE